VRPRPPEPSEPRPAPLHPDPAGAAAAESAGREAYRSAGVDVAAGHRAVELIREVAASATDPNVAEGIGGFAGLYHLDDRRLLAAATDGVGTKLEVARAVGRLDTVGVDLVAMCANDVACTGARPLFFLDYLAVERVVPEEVAAIVSGVAEGCRQAGCVLLGGETAEHRGAMPAGRFDMAGFCVGLVEVEAVLDPSSVRPGDGLVAFRSSGLHSNGYSLVRQALLRDEDALGAFVPALGRTLGEELLEPTAIYVRPLLALAAAGVVRSAAHITGGGLHENAPRAIPAGLGCVFESERWTPQPIFGIVAEAAGVTARELFGVLNMGIGMVAVVPRGREDEAVRTAAGAGADAMVVGWVSEEPGVHLR
jgi:phosphoribosylformylglycinamidine cyclo-ligase